MIIDHFADSIAFSNSGPLFPHYTPFTVYIGDPQVAHNVAVTIDYRRGFLRCDNQTIVHALSPCRNSHRFFVFSQTGEMAMSFSNTMDFENHFRLRTGTIIAGVNCHGFTFANSRYWINNDQIETLLVGDGWSMCNLDIAQIVIFRDINQDVVHSAKCNVGNARFVSKTGVHGIETAVDVAGAARGLAYDTATYYRK